MTDSALAETFSNALGKDWEVTVVSTGPAALAAMKEDRCDILVADFALPGMDGADLLNTAGPEHPRIVRFILVADADRDRLVNRVVGSHQCLVLPCEPLVLRTALERSLALNDWLANTRLRELVAGVRTFPPLPSLYLEVVSALKSPTVTTEQVGAIIARDLAMMTRLLQMINSAAYGLSRQITDPAEAVGILGFESIKSMVLSIKLLNDYDKIKPVYFSIDRLWRHSTEVARSARQLTLMHTGDQALAETAFAAGLTHDLGKAVLASNFDEQYRGAQSLARRQQIPLWEVEKEIFGGSHGDIGAYLLGLWGMPIDIQEVAAWHHHPERSTAREFTPLTAVHVANALAYHASVDEEDLLAPVIDDDYLERIGVLGQLPAWHEAISQRAGGNTEIRRKSGQTTAPTESETDPTPPPREPVRKAAPLPEPRENPRNQWFYPVAGTVVVLLLLGWFITERVIQQAEEAAGIHPRRITHAVESVPTGPDATAAPDEKNAAALPQPSQAPLPELKLQGIFFSPNDPKAIINGRLVHQHEVLDGVSVAEITRTSVTLQFKNVHRVLTLD